VVNGKNKNKNKTPEVNGRSVLFPALLIGYAFMVKETGKEQFSFSR
jgi:hypothetical protein